MRKLSIVVLCAVCMAFASTARSAEPRVSPLSPKPGAPFSLPMVGGGAAALSTGLVQQVAPSALTGRPTFVFLQGVDTTSPLGTNPDAGRNYDGILIPGGLCAAVSSCSVGETLCAGTCQDLSADPNNCGACGSVCLLLDGKTCQAGTCAVPPASCTLDSQCGTGAYCDTGTNTCAAQGAPGWLCATNSQCESGLTCQAFPTSFPCTIDSDCGGGGTCPGSLFCVYDLCLPVTCASDGDCSGTGVYCDTPTASCVSQAAAGTACAASDQCLSESCGGRWQFAERFVGQSLGVNGLFDTLSGTPTGPLALQVGLPYQNLDVIRDMFGDVILTGLGPVGYPPALPLVNPDYDGVGEGAIAFLLPSDFSEIAFDVYGVNGGGTMMIDFFRRDGSLIDSLTVPTGAFSPSERTIMVAFQRAGGISDIAGFSIYNTDPGGLGYANFQLGIVTNVPAPALSGAAVALLAAVLGFVGLAGLWRARGGVR